MPAGLPRELFTESGLLQPSATLFTQDVARLLRCSSRTVFRMIETGALRPVPGFRTYRFSGAELNRILAPSTMVDTHV
jgi:excisionase family DNA binding protein